MSSLVQIRGNSHALIAESNLDMAGESGAANCSVIRTLIDGSRRNLQWNWLPLRAKRIRPIV